MDDFSASLQEAAMLGIHLGVTVFALMFFLGLAFIALCFVGALLGLVFPGGK